ncbi:hypothetical protein ABH922_002782 [Rhodococcus sp. 27YEA15]|uniref:hypothetical protein n=1 Tax=Rhodococcus sp. 27YEA15 TaxID=3156259 RepID=UPI003C7DD241
MTALRTLMTWQADALAAIEAGTLQAISAPRPSGKTELMIEVARRTAAFGGRVLYLTRGEPLAANGWSRLVEPLRQHCPEVIAKATRSTGRHSVELTTGGEVRFVSVGASSRGVAGFDLAVCDDVNIEAFTIAQLMARRVVWAGWGAPPSGVSALRFGADLGDDLDDEATWLKANPGIGTTVTLDRLRQWQRAMPAEVFAREALNLVDPAARRTSGVSGHVTLRQLLAARATAAEADALATPAPEIIEGVGVS